MIAWGRKINLSAVISIWTQRVPPNAIWSIHRKCTSPKGFKKGAMSMTEIIRWPHLEQDRSPSPHFQPREEILTSLILSKFYFLYCVVPHLFAKLHNLFGKKGLSCMWRKSCWPFYRTQRISQLTRIYWQQPRHSGIKQWHGNSQEVRGKWWSLHWSQRGGRSTRFHKQAFCIRMVSGHCLPLTTLNSRSVQPNLSQGATSSPHIRGEVTTAAMLPWLSW